MRIDDITQGSNEWLCFRRDKVTATDISVIMGSNPWSTPEDLLGIKYGLIKVPETSCMREGKEKEEYVRRIACRDLETSFTPEIYTSDENPKFMASLDGISSDEQELIEIKVVGQSSWNKIVGEGIPLYYYHQMLWQMMCSGATVGYFIAFNKKTEKIHMNPITMNTPEIENMKAKASEFLDRLENFKKEMKEKGITS